jgi:hypothetical protein
MENHAKYGDSIYFHALGQVDGVRPASVSPNAPVPSLYVNLFIASELNWKELGMVVRQETRFPEEQGTRLTIVKVAKPTLMALVIRCPSWAKSGMTITVHAANGTRRTPADGRPGSYAGLMTEWHTGDQIEIRFPMSVHTEAMPDDPNTVALLYGPIVLAGDLGRDGMQDVKRFGPYAPQLDRIRTPEIPAFVVKDVNDVVAAVKPAAAANGTAPLTFTTSGIGRPRDVALLPFYKATDLRYTVYWKVYSPAEWDTHKSDTAAAESKRQTTERRTVDVVRIHDAASEREHAYAGEHATEGFFEGRRFRTTTANGWISYELKASDKPLKIVCSWRGAEGNRPVFDVIVDGQKVASESLGYHPTGTLDTEYVLPLALTSNKNTITVRFQAQPNSTVGALLEVRTVWADLQE